MLHARAASFAPSASVPARMSSSRSLLWFRKGLRVHDNPALASACEGADALQPVFVLDPWFLSPDRVGANRLRFLLESLDDLDANLRARGSSLLILHGDPTRVIPAALEEWRCDRLCYERDTEPYALKRDAAVAEAARRAGVDVRDPSGHTLYDVDALLAKCPGGAPPTAYASFLKIVNAFGPPSAPLPTPERLPPDLSNGGSAVDALVAPLEKSGAVRGRGAMTLEALGYPPLPVGEGFPARGGEKEGLARLRATLSRETYVATFEKPKTSPTELWGRRATGGGGEGGGKPADPFAAAKRASAKREEKNANLESGGAFLLAPSTTALSPYLKFGCVSPRTFYHELRAVLARHPKHTQPPTSLEGQLMWREFYYLVAKGTPNYDKMEGNGICRQIDWSWDKERLAAWEKGATGFPWIDACMAQLKKEGWMHHLARHAVACFLTRGDLFVHWEAGAAVFDRELVDADWAINNGNWMWLSCSCFFYQYFRVYGPVSFGKKYDKEGVFIKKYLPALRDMPAKYVYEPWLAPLDVQKRAKCVVGVDYPEPIVDHAVASKECIEKIAAAYKAHKEGTQAGTKRKAGE